MIKKLLLPFVINSEDLVFYQFLFLFQWNNRCQRTDQVDSLVLYADTAIALSQFLLFTKSFSVMNTKNIIQGQVFQVNLTSIFFPIFQRPAQVLIGRS